MKRYRLTNKYNYDSININGSYFYKSFYTFYDNIDNETIKQMIINKELEESILDLAGNVVYTSVMDNSDKVKIIDVYENVDLSKKIDVIEDKTINTLKDIKIIEDKDYNEIAEVLDNKNLEDLNFVSFEELVEDKPKKKKTKKEINFVKE